MRVTRTAAPLALALATLFPPAAAAQFEDVPPPAAYALQGVTLVRADGTRTEGVTIIVRGELIEAVGADLEIPGDAELLSGDSLFVYPGLFDGEGEVEFEFAESDIERSSVESWNPPRELQGFMPERRVVDHLDSELDGDAAGSQRNKGIVAAAIHPDNALMPGRGALMLFRPAAAGPSDMVVDPVLGPVLAFRAGRGVYPSQLFGIMAFIRQQFADAARHGSLSQAYGRAPRGMTVPQWDPAYEVIREIQAGTPVFFRADGSEDIRRVFQLADELGFRPILVGGGEAWKVAGELVARDVPVLVSLDFPEPERWERDESGTEAPSEEEAEPPPDGSADGEIQEAEAQEAEAQEAEPEDPAVWRERTRLEDLYANAGRLAEAGVRFALTSGGGGTDLLEGARLAIEYGLSEEEALRALTSTPAAMYGVPALSRVEPGYAATFIALDKPLFDEDAKLMYTFVEGDVERVGSAREAATGEAAVDLTGTWNLEISAEGFEISGTMTITQTGSSFEGDVSLDVGEAAIENGTVSGTEIRFSIVPDGDDPIEATGSVQGDRASGTGGSGDFSFRWTATRRPGGTR